MMKMLIFINFKGNISLVLHEEASIRLRKVGEKEMVPFLELQS